MHLRCNVPFIEWQDLANCILFQITPAFVREAYSLLRQSIIHVEHDAIDFDEEELEGERGRGQEGPTDNGEEGQMTGDATTDTVDESSIPVRVNVGGRQAAPQPAESSSRAGSVVPGTEPAPAPAPPKRRMIISHDKYIELQTMVVMHVANHEAKAGHGLDREELIDWYLEQREEEMQDIDQVEYEKELIVKLLRRLVKVMGIPFSVQPLVLTHYCPGKLSARGKGRRSRFNAFRR